MSDKMTLLRKELEIRNISLPGISENYTKTDFYQDAMSRLNMTDSQLTTYLWEHHHPDQIWMVLASIGVGTGILLMVYNYLMARKKSPAE